MWWGALTLWVGGFRLILRNLIGAVLFPAALISGELSGEGLTLLIGRVDSGVDKLELIVSHVHEEVRPHVVLAVGVIVVLIALLLIFEEDHLAVGLLGHRAVLFIVLGLELSKGEGGIFTVRDRGGRGGWVGRVGPQLCLSTESDH